MIKYDFVFSLSVLRILNCLKIELTRKIFGAKREELIGKWRKLLKMELHGLLSSCSIVRLIILGTLRCSKHK